jgi:hypothetical protein
MPVPLCVVCGLAAQFSNGGAQQLFGRFKYSAIPGGMIIIEAQSSELPARL